MKFEKILIHIRLNKKVRRSGWINKDYVLGDVICSECDGELSMEDILADDWEVVE